MTSLKGTNITITGGTGSFGRIMAQELLRDGAKEIRILSRDENKQYEMRNEFKDERLKFSQSKHDYLIEQLYYNETQNIVGPTESIRLNIDNPCKYIIWMLQQQYLYNIRYVL
jgi:NAD(P)-dependent dehydrogenase (short-subunit alcohol dehydrogenase family)